MPTRSEPELLEREAELEALQAGLEDARGGVGRLVVVEGVAGVGKTRLLRAARETAGRAGMQVLSARGTELEREFPFGAVRQLFEPLLHGANAAERVELLDGAARSAGAVVGVEAEDTSGDFDALLDPSFAILNALYWLTSNVAERQPALLAIDDLHWADKPSLRYLQFLLPRLEDLPVLLAVAARPAEPGAESELLAQLGADPGVRALRPRPLSEAAVADLVRAELAPAAHDAFCNACHYATGGNPFMLRELLVGLAAEGSTGTTADAAHVRGLAPDAIQRAVLVRLARLPEEARRLARAVAVLGDDADLREAAALAGIESGTGAKATDALAAAGIVESVRPPRFIHPLVRNSVYADMPGAEKAATHKQAADLLRGQGAEPERIAIHLLATDANADEAVVKTLAAAAQRALDRAAPETAMRYLQRALGEQPPDALRLVVLKQLLIAMFRAGDAHAFEGVGLGLDVLVDELTADPPVLMESARALATVLWGLGLSDQGAALLKRAIAAALEANDMDLALSLESLLMGLTQMPLAQGRARLAPYTERVEPGTESELNWLALRAWWVSFTPGESAAAAGQLAERALVDGRLLQFETPASRQAILVLIRTERVGQAERAIEQIVAGSRSRGSTTALGLAAYLRADLALARGEVARAAADIRAAVEASRQGGWLLAIPTQLALLVETLIERDELDAAEAELAAVGMTGPIPETYWFTPLLFARAHLCLAQGRPREAVDDLLKGARDLERLEMVNTYYPWAAYAVLGLAALGDNDQARRIFEPALDAARTWGAAPPIAALLRAQGLIEGGKPGIELLRAAVRTAERSPAKLEYMRALADYGAALRRANRRAEAREPLREALALARATGALAIARRAHEELGATGEKLRPLPAGGVESLTPSERRIAEMAAEGTTNRDIAQALFLTIKTIETHLSNAYRKLDIRSRSELETALASPPDHA